MPSCHGILQDRQDRTLVPNASGIFSARADSADTDQEDIHARRTIQSIIHVLADSARWVLTTSTWSSSAMVTSTCDIPRSSCSSRSHTAASGSPAPTSSYRSRRGNRRTRAKGPDADRPVIPPVRQPESGLTRSTRARLGMEREPERRIRELEPRRVVRVVYPTRHAGSVTHHSTATRHRG